MSTVLPIRSAIMADKLAHPEDIPIPHCQGQHTELDRLPILSSACHEERPRKAPSYSKPAFDALNDACQVRSTGVMVMESPGPTDHTLPPQPGER